ncbi:MAG TPA: LysR substrate-binding domain-containing protein [Steroidobacteraceae bacterium]|jgi:DNA-binding transcriptional LysR family regulator
MERSYSELQVRDDITAFALALYGLSLMLCGAPVYLEKHPAPQSPADLSGHNCLRYPYAPFADGWHFLDAAGNPIVARISGSLISSSPDTMRAAAVAGIGLVMTAPCLIGDLLASGARWCRCCRTIEHRSWRSTRSIPVAGI